jgi:branched-chain amino acid transport system ATP-binding protein
MTVLNVAGLEVRIGLQQILFGVSLSVEPDAIVAVLGSNGVGKTTLMRAVSGIYGATGGRVVFQGEDITNMGAHRIVSRGICQCPEGRQIFSNMTVLENLRMGAYHQPRHHFEEDLQKVFDLFPILSERRAQNAGSLSGGEQQMLTIARALMGRPKLLLMDEPSLGLAPILVRQIFEMVRRIRGEGCAILLVEQNAKAALSIADYAYIMDGGRIVLEGPSEELRQRKSVEAAYLGGHVTKPAEPTPGGEP